MGENYMLAGAAAAALVLYMLGALLRQKRGGLAHIIWCFTHATLDFA